MGWAVNDRCDREIADRARRRDTHDACLSHEFDGDQVVLRSAHLFARPPFMKRRKLVLSDGNWIRHIIYDRK